MYKILAILGILTLALPIVNAQNQTGTYNSTGTAVSCFENFALVILESSSKPQPKTAQPTTIISQDQVKKFISDFCNFYHERTGIWFRMTGEGFNQTVMKDFWTTYPIPAELKSYIIDNQQTNKTKP